MNSAVAVADVVREPPSRHRVVLAVAAAAGLAAVGISMAIALAGASSHAGLVAAARGLIVGAPIAVGLYAWHRRPEDRFGLVLLGTGAAAFTTTLAESGDDVLYTIGRAAGWVMEVLLVYVTLSFPTGRLPAAKDRLLVAAMGAAAALLYLPRVFVGQAFEVPSPYTSCVRDCPANAFFLLDREPAFVVDVMRPLGVLVVFVVLAGVVLRLHERSRQATPLTRRMLRPVIAVTMARAAVVGSALVLRELDPAAWPLQAVAWLLALAVPAIAIAFLMGLLQWRLFAAEALQRLADHVRDVPTAGMLRGVLADAFRDPAIEIVFPTDGSNGAWRDSMGRPIALPAPGSGRCVTEVGDRAAPVAALVHDEGLRARPELIRAGVAVAGVVLENQRLAAQAEASVRALQRSRARLASSAVRERRRIERDLHDGAQQRLVALRIELEVAEDLIRRDPQQGADRLHELEGELDAALEDLRSLAHGVYPSLLADRGLGDALKAAAERSAIPVELELRDVGRYPPEIESAVYFTVLEALQNVLKHAGGAHRVAVHVDGSARGELRFDVRDDGAGAAHVRPGAGITNMQDRLAAVGGEVAVTSAPGAGTQVRGRLPVAVHPDG